MQQAQVSGIDLAALENAARQGYAQGLFEEAGEDAPAVLEEFYPHPEAEEHDPHDPREASNGGQEPKASTAMLATQLARQMQRGAISASSKS